MTFLASTWAYETHVRYAPLNALKEYMGDDKVEESKYWEILDEVQKLDNSVPGFSDRVWKVQPPEDEFTLQLTTKTSGRNVDSAKFQEFIKKM